MNKVALIPDDSFSNKENRLSCTISFYIFGQLLNKTITTTHGVFNSFESITRGNVIWCEARRFSLCLVKKEH